MLKYTLSNSEATILGITDAGWFKLIENAGKRYNTIRGWSSTSLRADVLSAYQSYLNAKKLNYLLSLNTQFSSTIQNELKNKIPSITPLLKNFSAELNCRIWSFYCEIKGDSVDNESIKTYFSHPNHNLLTLCKRNKLRIENLITVLVNKKSDLASSLINEGHTDVLYLLQQFHKQWMLGFNQIDNKRTKKDHNLDLSKKVIVDTIQENIIRYYENKELIPIEMIIIKNDPSESFYPDLSSVIQKNDKHYSSAELRMVYKLMEEIPDKEIRDIMRASFFLKEMTLDGATKEQFNTLENPWDSDKVVGGGVFWQKRKRSSGAESYQFRSQESIPQWVRDLIRTKEECEKIANFRNNDIRIS